MLDYGEFNSNQGNAAASGNQTHEQQQSDFNRQGGGTQHTEVGQQSQSEMINQSLESQQSKPRKKQVRVRKSNVPSHSTLVEDEIDALEEDFLPDHLSGDNCESDEEEDADFRGRYKNFVLEKFLMDPQFEVGMKFEPCFNLSIL